MNLNDTFREHPDSLETVNPMENSSGGWKFVESSYSHKNTLGLGIYRGQPFVTGCSDQLGDCATKTEIMDIWVSDGEYSTRWDNAPDYPFSEHRLVHLKSYSEHGPSFHLKIFQGCLPVFNFTYFRCSIYHWWCSYRKYRSGIQRRVMAPTS